MSLVSQQPHSRNRTLDNIPKDALLAKDELQFALFQREMGNYLSTSVVVPRFPPAGKYSEYFIKQTKECIKLFPYKEIINAAKKNRKYLCKYGHLKPSEWETQKVMLQAKMDKSESDIVKKIYMLVQKWKFQMMLWNKRSYHHGWVTNHTTTTHFDVSYIHLYIFIIHATNVCYMHIRRP